MRFEIRRHVLERNKIIVTFEYWVPQDNGGCQKFTERHECSMTEAVEFVRKRKDEHIARLVGQLSDACDLCPQRLVDAGVEAWDEDMELRRAANA